MSNINTEEILQMPLDEILLNLGYYKDREKSSKNHIKLKNDNGDCAIISRNTKGHYLYFNPYDEKDRGNIFNFCKNRGVEWQSLINGEIQIAQRHNLEPKKQQEKKLSSDCSLQCFKQSQFREFLL